MPRIEADNIEAHIRLQTERILGAASQLFAERGYRATDMGDIARAVGLARNSLYRYYPNKDHILLACLERDMGPSLERVRRLAADYPDPRRRIEAWLKLQLEIAATSCHSAMQMMDEVHAKTPELRGQISALHEPPTRVLREAVAEILAGGERDPELLAEMIAGMLRAAAARAMAGADEPAVLAELRRAVARVLDE